MDIDADFDTKLYEDFALELLYIFFGCVGMDWGALALGDVGLSLEIYTLPPPSPKIKSQVKITKGWPGRPKILRESVWISCGC